MKEVQQKATEALQAELVRQLAHKLTSTIGAMLGFGELLGDPNLLQDPDFKEKTRNVFIREGTFSLDLLQNARDASALMAGMVELKCVSLPVLPALNSMVAEIQKVYPRRLVVKSKLTNATMLFDQYWFPQALRRLVENGIKFSQPHTSVIITLKEGGISGWGDITVRDYGPGIEPRNDQNIFALLAPVRKPVDPSFSTGLGLGLYIAHQIITLHQGHISYRSASDKGTIFTVSLPLVQN